MTSGLTSATPGLTSASGRTCALVSFRLGGTDGVSIVARRWQEIFTSLGWTVITVAGSGTVDRLVPGLALDAGNEGDARRPGDPNALVSEVAAALADADLVVVENLLSIPMQMKASRAVAKVLAGRPAILHHHDPPWQRERFSHITELPPTDQEWIHVTINKLTEEEFAARGIESTTIYNPFDTAQEPGDRAATRARLGIEPTERLVAHPVRAIERKNIPEALRLAEQLGATYWLSGAAEDGYATTLEQVLQTANCRVLRDPSPNMADLYAACDVVAFPSTWEGFGNPPIEASIHGKPVVVGSYPVADELIELGFQWFRSGDIDALRTFLEHPDTAMIENNRQVATKHLSPEVIAGQLKGLLNRAGW